MQSKNPNRPLAKLAKADSKSPWSFLSLLMITHFFIDTSASIINPLLQRLGVHHQVSDEAMGWVAGLLLASVSFSQPLFGYIYDRFRAYWLMPVLVLIAGCALACVGLADSYAMLLVLVLIGGLGVGAFHPMGTAMAGSLTEKHRPLIIAIFVFAGPIGVASGGWLVARLVDAQGLSATAWLLALTVPVLVVAILASLAYRKLPHSKPTPAKCPGSQQGSFFSRTVLLLFGLATSRSFSVVISTMGMAFLMAEKIRDISLASTHTGTAIAIFVIGLLIVGIVESS